MSARVRTLRSPVLTLVLTFVVAIAPSAIANQQRASACQDAPPRTEGVVSEFELTAPPSVHGIAPGPDGNMWFGSGTGQAREGTLGRITPEGSVREFPFDAGEPYGLTDGPDGNVWFVANLRASGVIGRFSPGDNIAGSLKTFFLRPASLLEAGTGIPVRIAAGPDGSLWFNSSNPLIGRITPEGEITEFPIPPAALPLALNKAWDITAGPDGNMWFTMNLLSAIGRITPQGDVDTFMLPVPLSTPVGITAGPDGNLWFAESSNRLGARIGRITPAGEITEFPVPTANSTPEYIAVGSDGNLWFTEQGAGKIGRITTHGEVKEFAVPTPSAAPNDIAPGPDGNLWFTEQGANKIGRITAVPSPALTASPSSGPAGSITTLSGSGFGSYERVEFTFLDPAGTAVSLDGTGTDTGGRFATQVTVPIDAARGGYQVLAEGTSSCVHTATSFEVI